MLGRCDYLNNKQIKSYFRRQFGNYRRFENIKAEVVHKSNDLLPKLQKYIKLNKNPMYCYGKEIRELVGLKQRLLYMCSEKYGMNSEDVHKLVNNIICSLEFRIYAVDKLYHTKGNKTPGVDAVILSRQNILGFITKLSYKSLMRYKASLIKRVFIPKSKYEKRPLGMPTIYDRLVQTLFVLVYEPILDPYSDKYSFGFRSGRCAHQAVGALASILS